MESIKDLDFFDNNSERRKRPNNHKMKPYLVLQYLLKNSDENHKRTSYDITAYLEDSCGLLAERRSIYRDIEEINKANLIIRDNCTIEEAESTLAEGYDEDKLIVYDKGKKGFYIKDRRFELNDIRLLAECIYATKFIAESEAERLVDIVCDYVSEYQVEKIKHHALLTDRVKTNNKYVLLNIGTINDAMSYKLDGQPHVPEKISFKYLKYSIDNLSQQIDRKKGERYVISPYLLLINDGNYYLLAYDDNKGKMVTYRVDRMKDIRFTGEERAGEEVFKQIDLKSYTQRVFNMYGGEERRITIRFIAPLLDTIIDRFGTKGVIYSKCDATHFTVSAKVQISPQFYGWLLGFGKKAKILEPEDEVEKFRSYIEEVKKMY